jgi:hypothetical protein
MAKPDQPKKETVRIELPLPTIINPPQPMVEPRETVRIQLPVHEADGSPLSSQSSPEAISLTNLFSPPNPPPLSAGVCPAPASPPAGLKGDTIRIPPQNQPIGPAAEEKNSMVLYWLLLGLSAFILIIQIWTYFS